MFVRERRRICGWRSSYVPAVRVCGGGLRGGKEQISDDSDSFGWMGCGRGQQQ